MRHRHHGPPPFVRRMGCGIAMMIIVAAICAAVFAQARTVVAIAVAGCLVCALMAGFMTTIRRMTRFFREQDRLRRQLMADVAHELRTPLAILQGRIEGLIDGVYPRDDAHIAELLTETQHLARLVEDVRTLANAEAGALDLQKERVDLGELIRETASSMAAPIAVDVPDDLPPIDADPVRVREVLFNLLSNALQHAPEGDVSVRAEARPREVVIVVRDNGPGIPADELPQLFQRFRKGRHSRGSGLGLAISQRLVAAHGGTIRVASAEGAGTTFTVTLPQ